MQEQQPRKRGSTAKRRRGARQKAMQALYQWDFDQAAYSPEHIVSQFCEMQNMDRVDVEYFEALFIHSAENTDAIDAEISKHLDRTLDQLDPIERSVLRVCCAELQTQLATPYKVVVNEALEISKDFGADKGYRYINGIADKLAASLRQVEYSRDHPDGNPLSEQEVKAPKQRVTPGNVKISIKEKDPRKNEPAKTAKPAATVGKAYGNRPAAQPATQTSFDKATPDDDKPAEAMPPAANKQANDKQPNDKQPDTDPSDTPPADSPWAQSPWVKNSQGESE